MNIQSVINELGSTYPFFATYKFNTFGAPYINGASPVDLGIVLLFLDELKLEANCVNLSEILSVSPLTCKNWVRKLREECICEIEWLSRSPVGKHYLVASMGIFNADLYNHFRSYVRLVIQNWRKTLHEQEEQHG